MGRWMVDHVLGAMSWESITLADASEQVFGLDVPGARLARVVGHELVTSAGAPVSVDEPGAAVVLAVPHTSLAEVAGWLVPRLAADATVIDLSHDQVRAAEALADTGGRTHVGLHALFGTAASAADGQTFVLRPSAVQPDRHRWLAAAIEAVGGTVNELTAERHDEVMRFVQTASHQALLTFADVIGRSGLDLEADLWANRTPVFELLVALASRVLTPGQEAVTSSIQLADGERSVAAAFASARERLDAALADGEDVAVADYIGELRAPFSGALFTKLQQAGVLATNAIVATRAAVAAHRRAGDLVGVRASAQGDRLHVGVVEKVTPTSFTLRDVLVGQQGSAVLLADEHSVANARKLGVTGKPKTVEFHLGRVRVLSPAELEGELDGWLASVARGAKLLVPESISAGAAVRLVESVDTVERAELVSDEVRLGERECVIRFWARCDRDLAEVERAIQRRVDEVFVWPDGVVLPAGSAPVDRIGFLGPAGTFSDIGGRQLARLLGVSAQCERLEYPDFPTLVAAVADGAVDVAVLPILNSSSGLVDLATGVLHDAAADVVAGGVVDVPVRFDAYVAPGVEPVAGDPVFSHPQGLRQCSSFVAAGRYAEMPCSSTAEACVEVARAGRGVALSAPGVGEELGLEVFRASVGNLAGALTRFLVLGREGRFSAAPARMEPTMRTVWTVAPEAAGDLPEADAASYDEVLRGPSGRMLVISTRADRLDGVSGVRRVGTIPWSPRTPLVVV